MVLLTVVSFLFILAFSITIHEVGHFIAAKLFKIPVEKFSIGFGPPLVSKKIGETDFRIAYFPLGGYVKMIGDDEEFALKSKKEEAKPALENKSLPAEEAGTAKALAVASVQLGFYEAPIFSRIGVVFSGPFFNIVSAFLLFAFISVVFGVLITPYTKIDVEKNSFAEKNGFVKGDSIISINGFEVRSWEDLWNIIEKNKNKTSKVKLIRNGATIERSIDTNIDSLGLRPLIPPTLGYVKMNGPAYKAGMKNGDRIIRINSEEIDTWYQLVDIVRKSRGTALFFEWQHDDEIRNAMITPTAIYDSTTRDTIGQISVMLTGIRSRVSFFKAINLGFKRSVFITWLTLKTLCQLIKGEISRKSLGGPIAIARLSGEAASWGFEYLLNLVALISINLGLVNLFPIPAFDGGHIIIAIFEAIRRKRLGRSTRLVIQQIGYAIILLIIIYVTFNDVTR